MDDFCYWYIFDLFLDYYFWCVCYDVRYLEVWVVVVCFGEGVLVGGFQLVVEFYFGVFNQFVDYFLDVGVG